LTWVWSAPEVVKPSIEDKNHVCFLNVRGEIRFPVHWNDSYYDKLWLYNLHYFDDLNAINSLSRRSEQLSLVKYWIMENLPVNGIGWEPYPLSLRLVNWVKWYNRAEIENVKIINSIEQQAEALSKQLEYHILGNHLFSNAKALIFVGCFLQDEKADYYLHLGLKILNREVPEQFLVDGGHFELSPMYHCILLWDLLDLINLAVITDSKPLRARESTWREVASKALNWLSTMVHPDGGISFFNDASFGIAAKPEQIFNYAKYLGLTVKTNSTRLATHHCSGYSRVAMGNYCLIIDHANVGPDYLPGHAHADSLSFELSVGQSRVLVNSGTSLYGSSAERLRQRGTQAHNTVCVEGENSSEVWSGFRVARRAYTTLHSAELIDDNVCIDASHDGYLRLSANISHRRIFQCSKNKIVIIDKLSGDSVVATAHLHIHPEISSHRVNGQTIELSLPEDNRKITVLFDNVVNLIESTWHPEFGVSVKNKVMVANLLNNQLVTIFSIE
jgi:uncharacterized heparinase superfamily protein